MSMDDVIATLYQRIDGFAPAELDKLPVGTIQLDANGTVLQFNRYESKLANLAPEKVIGKNFFKEVAPCTDVKEFHGRFLVGFARKELHERFRYHFAFKQNPRNVMVTLFYSTMTNTVWVFVQPIEHESPGA